MTRILLTGVSGFVGSHMAEFCLERGDEIAGTIRWRSPRENIARIEKDIQLYETDLRDRSAVDRVIRDFRPDRIFHLAAQSYVGSSFSSPHETLTTNIMGQLNLFEAVRDANLLETRIQIAGSSEQYGLVHENELPITESQPFRPLSPYGVSKVAQDLMAYQYYKSYGMFIVRTRAFNHSVPGYTPIIIRRNGFIDVVPIEEIVPHREDPRRGKRYQSDGGEIEIWDGEQWVHCLSRTAYWYKGNTRVIHARGANLETTPEHVVFTANGEKRSNMLSLDDHLILSSSLYSPCSTLLTAEESWFLGFMVAEGWVHKTEGKGQIGCHDRAALKKAAEIWGQVTGGYATFSEDGRETPLHGEAPPRIKLNGSSYYLKMLRKEIYNEDSSKRVPKRVLNASPSVQEEFLRGYNVGDGLKAGSGVDEFKSFRTTSSVLATGLMWLSKSALGREVAVYLQPGEISAYSYLINLTSGNIIGRSGQHWRKPKDEIRVIEPREYQGWMFDVETESGKFSAGPGMAVIHNSAPRRGDVFADSHFAKQIAEIELDRREPVIKVGDLTTYRDFTDARDIVRAYYRALDLGEAGEAYNICSGYVWRMSEVLQYLMTLSTRADIKIEEDPARIRPSDVPILLGDCSKFTKQTGWEPIIGFERTLADILDYWRERV